MADNVQQLTQSLTYMRQEQQEESDRKLAQLRSEFQDTLRFEQERAEAIRASEISSIRSASGHRNGGSDDPLTMNFPPTSPPRSAPDAPRDSASSRSGSDRLRSRSRDRDVSFRLSQPGPTTSHPTSATGMPGAPVGPAPVLVQAAAQPPRDLLAGWRQNFGKDRTADLDVFLHRFESYARNLQATDNLMIGRLLCVLEGRAASISRKLDLTMSWEEAKDTLREEWEPPARVDGFREQFESRIRKSKESAEDYLYELQKIADRAFATYNDESREDRVLRAFIRGQPQPVKASIHALQMKSTDEALSAVLRAEVYNRENRRTPGVRQVRHDEPAATMDYEESDDDSADSDAATVAVMEHDDSPLPDDAVEWMNHAFDTAIDNEDGTVEEYELFRVLKATVKQMDKSRNSFKCFFCGKPGHAWTKCFRLNDILVKNGMKPRDNNQRKPPNSGKDANKFRKFRPSNKDNKSKGDTSKPGN